MPGLKVPRYTQLRKTLNEYRLVEALMYNEELTPFSRRVFQELHACYVLMDKLDMKRTFKWEYDEKDLNRVKNLRLPVPEVYTINLFNKGFGFKKGVLPMQNDVRAEDIIKSHKDVIDVHCKYKPVQLDEGTVSRLIAYVNSFERYSKQEKITPMTLENAQDICFSFGNKSSCFPLYAKKNDINVINHTLEELSEILSENDYVKIFEKFNSKPVTVFPRNTPKIKDVNYESIKVNWKHRTVFGVPYSLILIERLLFGECEKIFKNMKYFSYGNKRVDTSKQVANLRSKCNFEKGQKIMSGDFDSFDANLSHFILLLILCIFQVLENNEDEDTIEYKLCKVFQIYFIFTPVIGTFGFRITCGGHISGAFLTSIIGSLAANLVLNDCWMKRNEGLLTEDNYVGLGDDFIMIIENETLTDLQESFKKLHYKMNESKLKFCYIRIDPIHYLGFSWDYLNEPIAELGWIIARCCYPEKFVDIEGRIRCFTRMCSIIFQSKDGIDYFNEILLKYDDYFRNHVYKKQNPIISYYDKAGTPYEVAIPLNNLLKLGWRNF